MANSRSNIYPVQLQGAELNLNKLDAEIKQYSGFNKNNSPFVGGCLSNIFTKNETIEGATSKNTYIAPNGDVYRVNTEGLFKNDAKVMDIDINDCYELVKLDISYKTVDIFDEYAFIYQRLNTENTFDYIFRFFDFNLNDWREELLTTYAYPTGVACYCERLLVDNKYIWCAGYKKRIKISNSVYNNTFNKFYLISSYKNNDEIVYVKNSINELQEQESNARELGMSFGLHVCYNHFDSKVYVALFPGNRSGSSYYDSNFCYVYDASITDAGITITLVKTLKGKTSGDEDYYEFEGAYTKANLSGVTRLLYFVFRNRLYAETIRNDTTAPYIGQTGYKIREDSETGIKIQFYDIMAYDTILSNDGKNFAYYKFGILTTDIGSGYEKAYCDYVTYPSVKDDKGYFALGAILGGVILLNNEEVTGLTLPGTKAILVSEWNTVDADNIYISYQGSYDYKDNEVVIYKTFNDECYKLIKTNSPLIKRIGNQLIVNSDCIPNSYDINTGITRLFAPSWNNRFYLKENSDFSKHCMIATSMNEYDLEDNASLLLNPVDILGLPPFYDDYHYLSISKIPTTVNVYISDADSTECLYRYSQFIKEEATNNVLVKKDLIDLPFPTNTDGNVQYSPSLFATEKGKYGNLVFISEGGTAYKLMTYDNKAVMSYFLSTAVEGLQDFFTIQGQLYGILDNQIYSFSIVNEIANRGDFIVSVEGLQFVGNTPYEALFFSKTNRCLYSFTGANVLNAKQFVDKISEVRNYKYNPATQSIFLITDIGVIVYSLFGIYQIEFLNCQDMYLLNNGVILTDNEGTFKYVKYYKEETTDDYTKENIQLETMFYGMNNQTVTINDCLYMRIFSEEHEEGDLEVSATTLSLEGRMTEKTTFKIKASDWDAITHTIYLRYQPKEQRGLGISFSINSPFKIASLSIGSQADAILIDKVSKGAINAPQRTSNNVEW